MKGTNMKWYVKNDDGTMLGPFDQDEALEVANRIDGLVVADVFAEDEGVTDTEGEPVTSDLIRDLRAFAGKEPGRWSSEMMEAAARELERLSSPRKVALTVEGGCVEVEECPEDVEIDIRDYDVDGADLDIMNK